MILEDLGLLVGGFIVGFFTCWHYCKLLWKKKSMEIKNIKTSYGNFPTMIHYENYWKNKVREAEDK